MKIALIGDYGEDVIAHRAIPLSLEHEARARDIEIEFTWCHSSDLSGKDALAGFDAGWAVPASPYANMDNVLSVIRDLREDGRPFLGTCGGYQHALVEYARNVLGHPQAGISEVDPYCPMPVVSALTCALIEQSDPILPEPGGIIDRLAGSEPLSETYHCSFGINPELAHLFEGSQMQVAARDPDGAIRAMALEGHPFFVGTAFQPERAALDGQRHPIVTGFVDAVLS